MAKDLHDATTDELYKKIKLCATENAFNGTNAYDFDVVEACRGVLLSREHDKAKKDSISKEVDRVYDKTFKESKDEFLDRLIR